jgi:hypothetical protein
MVIQQSMASENFSFFYHAFASILPANRSDFFNTHACCRQVTDSEFEQRDGQHDLQYFAEMSHQSTVKTLGPRRVSCTVPRGFPHHRSDSRCR